MIARTQWTLRPSLRWRLPSPSARRLPSPRRRDGRASRHQLDTCQDSSQPQCSSASLLTARREDIHVAGLASHASAVLRDLGGSLVLNNVVHGGTLTAHRGLASNTGGDSQAMRSAAAWLGTERASTSGQLPEQARRQLTLAIMSSSSWHQVHTVMRLHAEQLDHIHLSAAMVKAAKLAQGCREAQRHGQPELYALVEHLCRSVPGCIHLLDHRQTSNMIWSLAVLMPALQGPRAHGQGPAAGAPDAAAAASASSAAMHEAQRLSLKLQQFWDEAAPSPQALANTIWAMARLGLRPSDYWLRGFLASSQPQLGHFLPQELSSTLWALATLRIWPGSSWGAASVAACSTGLHAFGPQALANTLWALVKLGLPLPPGFVQQVSRACLAKLSKAPADGAEPSAAEGFLPQQLSSILWSLAKLQQHRPPPQVPGTVQAQRAALAAPGLRAALPVERAQPQQQAEPLLHDPAACQEHLVAAIVSHAEPLLQSMPAQALVNMAWALARLNHTPTSTWTAKLLRATAQRARSLTPAGLCQLMWALSRWGTRPTPQWFQGVTKAALDKGLPSHMTARQLSVVAAACAKMGGRPVPGFVHVLVAGTGAQLASCDAVTAAELCGAFGQMRVWPGRAWMRRLYGLVRRGYSDLAPSHVAKLLGGIAAMPAHASGNNASGASRQPSWAAAVAASSQGWASSSGSSQDVGLLKAPASIVQLLLDHLLRQARNGHVCDLAEVTWAAARLGHRPAAEWLRSLLLLLSGPAMKQLSGRAALQLLCALQLLGVRPATGLLEQASEQLLSKASVLGEDEVALLLALVSGQLALPGEEGAAGAAWGCAAVLRKALLAGLARLPTKQLASLVCCAAASKQAMDPAWAAAVEHATLSRLALPGFGGMSSAVRVSLLGALLFSGHTPAPAWLDQWCAAVAAGCKHLEPRQLLAAARLLNAANLATAGASRADAPQVMSRESQRGLLQALDAAAADAARRFPTLPSLKASEAAAAGDDSPWEVTSLHAWGPGRMAALAAHLQVAGHSPSRALHQASEAALALNLHSGPGGRAETASRVVLALIEMATLPSRRCGTVAPQAAVSFMLEHLMAMQPAQVLDAVQRAAAQGSGSAEPDPLQPFYHGLAIRPEGSAVSGVFASAPRMLCALLDMMAAWGVQPTRLWLAGLVSGACSRAQMEDSALPLAGPQAMSLLKAVALIQVPVPERVVKDLLVLLTAQRLSECSAKQVAEVAWSLGALAYRPEPGWWDQYEAVLLSAALAPREEERWSQRDAVLELQRAPAAVPPAPSAAVLLVDTMAGKQLCDVVWGCAALRLTPSTLLLSRLASASARKLTSLDPTSLSDLLWSLFILDEGGPGPAWMDLWLSEAAAKMVDFHAHDLAMAATGLATARYKPRQEWLNKFLAQSVAKAAQCRGAQLASIVCSLADLDCHPEPSWLATFAECARQPSVAKDLGEASYSQLAWAFDRLSRGSMPAAAYMPPRIAAKLNRARPSEPSRALPLSRFGAVRSMRAGAGKLKVRKQAASKDAAMS